MNKKLSSIFETFILFAVGFCTYITIECCYRQISYWEMGFCGGLAIVFLDRLNNEISWNIDILFQGLIGSALISSLELLIGTLSLNGILPQMWDYSKLPLNYKGIVCVPFSLIWVGLSIIAIMIADSIHYYVFEELPVPYYKLFGKVIIRFKEKKCKF